MAAYKRQHYVPQFYLRAFSSDGRSINLWNLRRAKRVLGAKLRTQCSGSYFYGKDLELEKALGAMETLSARILREVADGSARRLETEERLAMLVYMLVQNARTQYAVEQLDEQADGLAKEFLAPTLDQLGIDAASIRIGLEDGARLSVATALKAIPMTWDLSVRVLWNRTEVEFVTSDNPVVLYNQLMSFNREGSSTGYACKGLQIFFPVGPRHLVAFFDRGVYSCGRDKDGTVEVTKPRDVYELNTLQMVAALENVYFQDPGLDVGALHRRSQGFRRSQKSDMGVYPGQTEREGPRDRLVRISREDVRTNLSLSFMAVTRSAKAWRKHIRKLTVRPVSFLRDGQIG